MRSVNVEETEPSEMATAGVARGNRERGRTRASHAEPITEREREISRPLKVLVWPGATLCWSTLLSKHLHLAHAILTWLGEGKGGQFNVRMAKKKPIAQLVTHVMKQSS